MAAKYRLSVKEAMRILNYHGFDLRQYGFSPDEFKTLKEAVAKGEIKNRDEE